MSPTSDQDYFRDYYEDLVEKVLRGGLAKGKIVRYERTKRGSEADTKEKKDFIVYFKDSPPLTLQVKGTRFRLSDRGKKRQAYKAFLVDEGVKLLMLTKFSTEDLVWAMIWFLQNVLDLMALPGGDGWTESIIALEQLELKGVVSHYEPVALGFWEVTLASGESRRLHFPEGTSVQKATEMICGAPLTTRKRSRRTW
ncbi:MAG: hypothetical protein AAB486_01430 [Patescibacteria group bacterium]|mgnify:CR=1 FL=1